MIVSALESGGQGRNRTADASLFRAALDRSFWHLGCIRFILFEASYIDHLRAFGQTENSQSSNRRRLELENVAYWWIFADLPDTWLPR